MKSPMTTNLKGPTPAAGAGCGRAVLGLAIGALLATSASAQVHPEKPTWKYEKCYGVAAAGHNDCFFASNSCATTSTMDRDPAAWIYMPKGSCERIVGGTLEPPKR
jgi:uncharacterized membrane protein